MLCNLIKTILLMFVLVTSVEAADVKIGVVDTKKAIMQTAKAKSMSEQFVKDFTKDEERVQKLESELKTLNDKRTKDGSSMSKADQEALMKQMQSKSHQRGEIVKKIKQEEQKRFEALLKAVEPKIKEVMKDVAAKGSYTIIVEKAATPYYDQADDLTQATTEKLNQVLK